MSEQSHLPFGGITYVPGRDGPRLGAQLLRVLSVMSDGQWYTLRLIAKRTGDPEASISARLRDFRKRQFGRFIVDAEYVKRGLWRYRLRATAVEKAA